MAEEALHQQKSWQQRDDEARRFWPDCVHAARGYNRQFDLSDAMRLAMNEYFRKIDAAVSKALETGCIYMKHRWTRKHPELLILLFSDGKGKSFQRSLKMDQSFETNRTPLHFHDYWWFYFAITNMIFYEQKVKPDPRGGYFLPIVRQPQSAEPQI